MSRKTVLVIDEGEENADFVKLYFSGTPHEVFVASGAEPREKLLNDTDPEIIFISAAKLRGPLLRVLNFFSKAHPAVKIFSLGKVKEDIPFLTSELNLPLESDSFQNAVLKFMVMPRAFRVVIVDDEKDVCENLKEFLELRKNPVFEVTYALNGLEGFKVIQGFKPDAAVLDVKMPVKGGVELCKELLHTRLCRNIVILTAAVSYEELRELSSQGSVTILEKGSPSSYFSELLSTLRKLAAFSS
ncbi:MAG: response regulator [Candidatus Omnitrophica bacterium]|nr:response regulator [Candidatus Omnitrophota bacterium]